MFARARGLLGGSLVLVALAVGACGGGSDPGGGGGGDSSALGGQPTVAGQISGWTRGAQTLQVGIDKQFATLASAPIDAAGNFSVVLPSVGVVLPFGKKEDFSSGSVAGCQGTVSATPPIYTAAYLKLTVAIGNQTLYVAQSATKDLAETLTRYVYVDRQVDQTGSSTCPTSGTWNYDLHYKQGWNRVLDTADPNLGPFTLNIATGAAPAGAVWVAR